jgi:uncharacterized membrane protein
MASKARFLLGLVLPGLVAILLLAATLTVSAREAGTDTYAASFGADELQGSAAPGATATYALTLTNTGTQGDTYDIEVLPGPADWAAWASVATVSLAPGRSETFEVEVEIPVYCGYGELEMTAVLALSESDPATYATVTLVTTVVDTMYSNGFENPD